MARASKKNAQALSLPPPGGTPAPESTKPPRYVPAPRRYVTALYARATEDEKRCIERKAREAGLSVSRYLVRAAAQEKLPPSREERARLESLLSRFKRASLFLDHLVASGAGLEPASVLQQQEIREAAKLLASIANELKSRL